MVSNIPNASLSSQPDQNRCPVPSCPYKRPSPAWFPPILPLPSHSPRKFVFLIHRQPRLSSNPFNSLHHQLFHDVFHREQPSRRFWWSSTPKRAAPRHRWVSEIFFGVPFSFNFEVAFVQLGELTQHRVWQLKWVATRCVVLWCVVGRFL